MPRRNRRAVPARVRAVLDLRRSSATTPRDTRRHPRSTAKRVAIRESQRGE